MERWKASLGPMVEAARTGLKNEGYKCREKMGLRGGNLSFRSVCPSGPGYLLCLTRLKACVRLAWPKVEPDALKQWKESEFGKEYRYLLGAAERYLKKQKDRLELELIEAEPDQYDQEE